MNSISNTSNIKPFSTISEIKPKVLTPTSAENTNVSGADAFTSSQVTSEPLMSPLQVTKTISSEKQLFTSDSTGIIAEKEAIYQSASFLPPTQGGVLNTTAQQIYNSAIKREPVITDVIKNIANDTGLDLIGLEFRLKTEESFVRKMALNPENDYDIIRYTMLGSPEELVEKTEKVMKSFKQAGYETVLMKNSWNDPANPYKGLNTIVVSPEGQKFELQYHTQESFDMKQGPMHKLYEKWRATPPKSTEAMALIHEMLSISGSLRRPTNVSSLTQKTLG